MWLALVGAALVVVAVAALVIVATVDSGTSSASAVAPNSVGRIDAATDELVAAIATTGTAPGAIVWAEGSLWVANTVSRTVARIDPGTNRVVQTVPSSGAPTDLAAGDGMVWVLNGLDGTVLAIDPRTNEVTGTTDVAVGSAGIAVGAGAVWVTEAFDATVLRIDPETRQVVERIHLGEPGTVSPQAIALDDDSLWVADGLNPRLLEVDTATGEVVATPGLLAVPTEIAVGAHGTVWVTSCDADLVSVLDPETLQTTTVSVDRGPTGVAAGDGWVWVVASRDWTVARIDAESERVVATIRTGPIPDELAIGGGSIWVSVHA